MNYIGLTGSNTHAMAQVAEILLQQVTERGLNVAVLLYIEDPVQVQLLRMQPGHGQLWRIGTDPTRPALDEHVDVFIHSFLSRRGFKREISYRLQQYTQRLTSIIPASAVPAATTAT